MNRGCFENHLYFLAKHRGEVTPLRGAFSMVSDRPEFTFAFIIDADFDREVLRRHRSLYLMSWCTPVATDLTQAGYMKKGGVTYMSLPGSPNGWPRNPEIEVRRASTSAELDAFSEVQARAFLEKEESYREWKPILKRANDRNGSDSTQHFYVGFQNREPVGAALLVEHADTLGIYAVSTLPSHRKMGISSRVMAQALENAAGAKSPRIVLQVSSGSYAESFYKKLGFVTDYTAQIYAA